MSSHDMLPEASGRHREPREDADSYFGTGAPPAHLRVVPNRTVLKSTSRNLQMPLLAGDVGYNLPALHSRTVGSGMLEAISTGIHVQIPRGFWGLILPRSSVNIEGKLIVLPSIIDEGYRGELMVLVHNVSSLMYWVQRGRSLASLVLLPAFVPEIEYVDELDESERGNRGFGSTGD